jgi:adenylate cyclase
MDEANLAVLTTLAALLTRFGEWDRAIATAKRAVSLAPNDYASINRLGAALEQSAMCEQAIPHLHKAVRLNPLFPPFPLGLLGVCHMWMEQYEEAIPFLERSLKYTPGSADKLMLLAACYAGSDRDDEARATIEKALKSSPGLTVKQFIHGFAQKDHAAKERLADLLRKAGMPD